MAPTSFTHDTESASQLLDDLVSRNNSDFINLHDVATFLCTRPTYSNISIRFSSGLFYHKHLNFTTFIWYKQWHAITKLMVSCSRNHSPYGIEWRAWLHFNRHQCPLVAILINPVHGMIFGWPGILAIVTMGCLIPTLRGTKPTNSRGTVKAQSWSPGKIETIYGGYTPESI